MLIEACDCVKEGGPYCGIEWIEVVAGDKAVAACGELPPEASIAMLRKAETGH